MSAIRQIDPDLLRNVNNIEAMNLLYDWSLWARPEQLQPVELGKNGKFIWFIKAGRGTGKTRTGAQWVINKIKNEGYRHIALAGATAPEVRTIAIEGESGLLACSPPWFYPDYQPSKKQIVWPNGAKAQIFYGTEPEQARGAQHDLLWADEVAKWKYPQETFDNLLLGLRLGSNPLCLVSSTPKPTKFIKELAARKDTITTHGNTFENLDNLAKPFIETIIAKYKGTRLERQEIFAQILDDNPNALWHRDWIDFNRVVYIPDNLSRIMVAIDPAASHDSETSDETGIIVVAEGRALYGMSFPELPHYYVIEDLSLVATPEKWARQAIAAYHRHKANKIIAERNQGGDMVMSTLKNIDKNVPVELVWASRGKATRAEPISALYEQNRVHHIGTFDLLEDEMCEWCAGMDSPSRMDALVWGLTSLTNKAEPNIRIL